MKLTLIIISEAWLIAIFGLGLSLFTYLVRKAVKPNMDFFKILKDFQKRLPPSGKKAYKKDSFFGITHLNTSQMQINNLSTSNIDLFQKELEDFNYKRVLFKRKEIELYSNNLQRILKDSAWEKFGIAIIQQILEDESFEKNKPYIFGSRIGKIIGF
jgi:hypothetical protein